MSETQYDKPMHFVNAKRVRVGEKTKNGADKTVLTFGLTKDRDGNEINTLDQLIDTLLQYQGKQVNLSVFVREVESNGRTFPSASVGITEMVPRGEGGGQTKFVPKKSTSTATENANKIRQQFSKG